MKWLRPRLWQRKVYYCQTCGFNFRRNFMGEVTENVLYAIGMLNTFKDAVLFLSKEDYTFYMDSVDNAVFTPFINSTNIKKEHDDKIRRQTG